jgi:hypothetical protein
MSMIAIAFSIDAHPIDQPEINDVDAEFRVDDVVQRFFDLGSRWQLRRSRSWCLLRHRSGLYQRVLRSEPTQQGAFDSSRELAHPVNAAPSPKRSSASSNALPTGVHQLTKVGKTNLELRHRFPSESSPTAQTWKLARWSSPDPPKRCPRSRHQQRALAAALSSPQVGFTWNDSPSYGSRNPTPTGCVSRGPG